MNMSHVEYCTQEPHRQWQQQSRAWRAKLRVGVSKPWTSQQSFCGYGLPASARKRDLIDCVYMQRCSILGFDYKDVSRNRREEGVSGLLLDVSQSHQRQCSSNLDGEARCLTTSSQLYWYGHDRLLQPVEHLYLQGFDVRTRIPDSFGPSDVRKVAGEGIALPCLGLVVWSLLVCYGLGSESETEAACKDK